MSATTVIKALLDRGVREFIVCAGARNLSLIESLANQKEILLWHHFEERSAGFFALGRTMATGEPCCVVTTSGTAVAELLPAVVEAYYQSRPLIVLSADRPSSYRGSGAPQAIEQVDIFSQYVEQCIDVESTECDLSDWTGRVPLHLNVCLEEVEEAVQEVLEIGTFQQNRQQIMVGDLVHFIRDAWDGLVVALGGLEPEDREEVFHFLKDLKVPVIADATSGLREALGKLSIANPERVLHSGMVGKVLRIGEVPVGRFWRDLEDLQDIQVFSVTRSGFSGLPRMSKVIHGDITRVLKGMGEIEEVGDVAAVMVDNPKGWAYIDESLEAFPDSEPGLIRVVSQYVATAGSLYLGNSLPIREWNSFAQRDVPIEFVRANRGANGIDGQISTWLGCSAGVDDSWCVLGDLTTLYDLTALSLLEAVGGERRVLIVINNAGGQIFSRLERVRSLEPETQELIENTHEVSFSHVAAMWGMKYLKFTSADEVEIEPGETPLLVELIPDSKQTELFWEKLK